MILNTKEYYNENDNSLVTFLNINNYSFLFMGDACVSKEKSIINVIIVLRKWLFMLKINNIIIIL